MGVCHRKINAESILADWVVIVLFRFSKSHVRMAAGHTYKMAEIKPFRAYRYDTSKVDAANVLTQPYDKITPEMQRQYAAASPYNLVTIEKGIFATHRFICGQCLYPGRSRA